MPERIEPQINTLGHFEILLEALDDIKLRNLRGKIDATELQKVQHEIQSAIIIPEIEAQYLVEQLDVRSDVDIWKKILHDFPERMTAWANNGIAQDIIARFYQTFRTETHQRIVQRLANFIIPIMPEPLQDQNPERFKRLVGILSKEENKREIMSLLDIYVYVQGEEETPPPELESALGEFLQTLETEQQQALLKLVTHALAFAEKQYGEQNFSIFCLFADELSGQGSLAKVIVTVPIKPTDADKITVNFVPENLLRRDVEENIRDTVVRATLSTLKSAGKAMTLNSLDVQIQNIRVPEVALEVTGGVKVVGNSLGGAVAAALIARALLRSTTHTAITAEVLGTGDINPVGAIEPKVQAVLTYNSRAPQYAEPLIERLIVHKRNKEEAQDIINEAQSTVEVIVISYVRELLDSGAVVSPFTRYIERVKQYSETQPLASDQDHDVEFYDGIFKKSSEKINEQIFPNLYGSESEPVAKYMAMKFAQKYNTDVIPVIIDIENPQPTLFETIQQSIQAIDPDIDRQDILNRFNSYDRLVLICHGSPERKANPLFGDYSFVKEIRERREYCQQRIIVVAPNYHVMKEWAEIL